MAHGLRGRGAPRKPRGVVGRGGAEPSTSAAIVQTGMDSGQFRYACVYDAPQQGRSGPGGEGARIGHWEDQGGAASVPVGQLLFVGGIGTTSIR